MPHPLLKNAPIVEAVLQAQVVIPSSDPLPELQALSQKFLQEYPDQKTDRSVEVGLKFDLHSEMPPGELTRTEGVLGYKLVSRDGKQMLHFHKTAFTFNRLAPYISWDAFMGSAKPAWDAYRSQFPEAIVTRLGLRYINRINIAASDGPMIRLEEYFAASPPDIKVDGIHYIGFLNQSALVDSRTGLRANWILAQEASQAPQTLTTVLDIDVYDESAQVQEKDPCDIWPIMRNLKNDLFFGSFTSKGISLFE